MNIIILSGGSGKRLWPLTNGQRSKQFIKCLKREDGAAESMLQRVYRHINEIYTDAITVVAANNIQVETIHNQIGENLCISAEPCGRDTFAAIALASAYFTDRLDVNADEAVVVCPSDFYAERGFYELFEKMTTEITAGLADMVLIGKKPQYAYSEYGYIVPDCKKDNKEITEKHKDHSSYKIKRFVEKPDIMRAEELIREGALWNCGVFAFKFSFLKRIVSEMTGCGSYEEMLEAYPGLPKISFDNAVVEKQDNLRVISFDGEWRDIGTWNSLTDIMEEHVHGNVIMSDNCQDINVVNELGIPVLIVGMENVIVSATNEGILISNKDQSGSIKKYIDGYY